LDGTIGPFKTTIASQS